MPDASVATPATEAPAPPVPATDEPYEDEDEDEDDTEARAEVLSAEPPPSIGGMTPEMATMANFFTQLMDRRDAQLLDELDRRVSAIRSELPVPNGVAHAERGAELASRPGEYPPSLLYAQPRTVSDRDREADPSPVPALPARHLVAFIPKDDPYNPKQTTFKAWVNGREYRSKRGQVMIVEAAAGIEWAKNGHGNCVDIAAMQGVGTIEPMAIPQQPDYSRPNDWDGRPLTNRSSIPIGR